MSLPSQPHECSFCEEPSLQHLMLPIGMAPPKAKDQNTQKDERRQVIVRFCVRHWAELQARLIQMGRQN